MALIEAIGRAVAAQRGHLLCWAPVFLAIGIGGYFALPVEPGVLHWSLLAVATGLLALVALWLPEDWRPLAAALIWVAAGAMVAGARAHLVAEPVLGFRYYGPIQGRIVNVDRSASDAVRLTLDRVVLSRMAPADTPARVRVSLHGTQGFITPEPGLVVMMTGHLSPPSGPVEPGGFDFRRQAWFARLGAVGYTRTPVLAWAPPETGDIGLTIHRIRMAISAWVRARMSDDAGAFAAAVMTGDRSALDRDALEDLRASNLAHLLAISGLHMGLLTGFVFATVRSLLALVPHVALYWPVKKIAAVCALAVGAGYLALSGGNVATQRAFIMVAVMFAAVLLDQRAITLRAVALAALIVLALRPEVLAGPGFQMSFAATVALVAAFSALRGWSGWRPRRWLRPVLAVAISSAVAGAATAPVAAAHFNRIADFGLLANLASVPLMGLVVMPGAVLTAVLAPLGLGELGLAVMRPAIEWILGVAHWVAALDGAVTYVPAAPRMVLPLLAVGALWVVLWQGRAHLRALGLLPMAAGLFLWVGVERPVVLISDNGGLVGVLGPEGRVLNKPRGQGFAAENWLENDGDGASQDEAFRRPGMTGGSGTTEFTVDRRRLVHVGGRGAAKKAAAACARAEFVVVTVEAALSDGRCVLFDRQTLRASGSVALYRRRGELAIITARDMAGNRLWNVR